MIPYENWSYEEELAKRQGSSWGAVTRRSHTYNKKLGHKSVGGNDMYGSNYWGRKYVVRH